MAGLVLLGAGAGLALPTSSGSVVGSVPRDHSGIASATNTTANQVGGALAVAARLPVASGERLAQLARAAFASGLDLGLLAAAGVAVAGLLVTVIWLPRRAQAD